MLHCKQGNYYNEHDPKAAAWLRELIKAGLIPAGWVDERSIVDVNPYELTNYTQHHFFAGIGGWSLALELAGWPETRPVVTGSCPCQPFSAAGLGLGEKDERHLWPVFRDIITHLAASVVFGEQVASKAGRKWLAGVRADLEGLGYAVGAADLCAAGVRSPHIRQRLYWVAKLARKRRKERLSEKGETCGVRSATKRSCAVVRLGDSDGTGSQSWRQTTQGDGYRSSAITDGRPFRMEYAASDRRIERRAESGERSTVGGCWDMFDITHCTDGKARRFESGSFPLAHGVPDRVGLLRGYGNAIVPQVAAEFIGAFLEVI